MAVSEKRVESMQLAVIRQDEANECAAWLKKYVEKMFLQPESRKMFERIIAVLRPDDKGKRRSVAESA